MFEETINDTIFEIKVKIKLNDSLGNTEVKEKFINSNGGYQISFVDFNIALSQKFDVMGEIKKILYGHDDNDKFIFNTYTQTT